MEEFIGPQSVNTGLESVLAYDNIAIVVLMLMVLMEATMIYYLLKNLFKVKDVLEKLQNAITILNERLTHYHDEH